MPRRPGDGGSSVSPAAGTIGHDRSPASRCCALAPLQSLATRHAALSAEEQAHIEHWLARSAALAGLDYDLAVEVASNQRLVKGYGDTHARGWKQLQRGCWRPRSSSVGDRMRRRRSERLAARRCADENGAALDRALADLDRAWCERRRDDERSWPVNRTSDADAIRALVREDCVHRDVYLSQEIFELEMRGCGATPGSTSATTARFPTPVTTTRPRLRGSRSSCCATRGQVRVLMNRCAHKGATCSSARARPLRGRAVALPLSRLDLSTRRLDPHDPDAQSGYAGTALAGSSRPRRRRPAARRELSGFRVRAAGGGRASGSTSTSATR